MTLLNRKIIFSIIMFFCLGAFVSQAAVDPVVVEVHYQSGVKFYNRGLYKKAVREFENTLSLDPEHREAAEYLQKAKAAAKNEQVKDARESKNDEIRRLYEEGKGLYLKRDYKAAIDVFDQILSAKPIDDFASFYKERCEIMIARQLAREKKVEDKKNVHEDVGRIKEEKIKEKKLKELDKQEMLKNLREERAQAVAVAPAREERQRARQEKIDQAKQVREIKQEEKKALAEEKKVKKDEAKQNKKEVKVQKQEKKQEQKDLKELFLKGVEEYGRKEYESAIASFEAVIEAESQGKQLYSSSAARLMDKTKMKMKEVPGKE